LLLQVCALAASGWQQATLGGCAGAAVAAAAAKVEVAVVHLAVQGVCFLASLQRHLMNPAEHAVVVVVAVAVASWEADSAAAAVVLRVLVLAQSSQLPQWR
jgi:hypothetical protein